MTLTYESIAGRIDHALLTPTMTVAEMIAGCHLAARYEVATVCIKPFAVPLAITELRGTSVGVGTVVGFPHGATTRRSKVDETIEAIEAGATEIDMVVNIGAVLSGDWTQVGAEIETINRAAHDRHALLKVIFETCYLTDPQKIELCQICGRLGVDYVKTSTGFGTNGATPEDIALMRRTSPPALRVKASGNIKNLAAAIQFSELGADRLGLSRTAEVLDELCDRLGQPRRTVSRETKPIDQPSSDY